MSLRITDIGSDVLLSVVEHVFLPPKLPQEALTEKAEREINVSLCYVLIQVARVFSQGLSPLQQSSWAHMINMMGYIYRAVRAPLVEAEPAGALSGLNVGGALEFPRTGPLCHRSSSPSDVFVMHVRAQNAAVLVRVLVDHVRLEMFEVSPQASVVTSTNGKLLCSYPGPADQVPAELFSNRYFLQELASFLIQMDADVLDSAAAAVKAGSTVREVRESAHPKYITELLVGILRGFGQPASVGRITKRIADEVLWKDAYKPWRRSPLWLVIRVALQTSLDSNMYKSFMLVFHTYILNICIQRNFPSETLYLMRVKIARRLSKLGPAVLDGVYQAVHHAAKNTGTLLQNRWSSFQKSRSASLAWNPEQLDVVNDVAITLNNSRPFLMNALHSTIHSYSSKSFNPSHRPRLASTGALGLSDPTWDIRLPPVSEDKGQYSMPRGGQGQAVSSGFKPAKGAYQSYDLPGELAGIARRGATPGGLVAIGVSVSGEEGGFLLGVYSQPASTALALRSHTHSGQPKRVAPFEAPAALFRPHVVPISEVISLWDPSAIRRSDSGKRYLDYWVDAHQHDENAPDVVASYIEQYFDITRDTYGVDPEDNSVMILTIMGLWMALDKLTTRQCPLLMSYSPEIPRDFLHPLLLHRSSSLQRATFIEEHILRWHQGASYPTSVFSDSATESSFAAQYFRTSQMLQQLEVEITQHAWEERILKHAELDSLNGQWELLKYMAAEMDHTYLEDKGNSTHRKSWCQKCQANIMASKLKIGVHEWPLPQTTVQAQLVIFELSPPRAFSTWREITYKILCDIGMPNASDSADQPKLLMDTFSGLV
ncbi:hypothetical protein EDB89DRAFT_2231510 [Lactarius sanguifluus]|nr:hypothetical protein EDB89DRAFT_2231510 [Lactarius sanguifluus]